MKKGYVKPKLAPAPRAAGPKQPPNVSAPAPLPPTPAILPAPSEAAFQPKVYAPADIACCHQNNDLTNCGAEAGEPCHWQQSGMDGAFHPERIANAAAASQREGNKPTREQFDQAAWDSGLF